MALFSIINNDVFLGYDPKNVKNDESMKTNTHILLGIMIELRLCHKDVLEMRNSRDLMHFVCT